MYNKQLDVFIKAAELGSFSKAAEALFITPSAVIQQINALEDRLKVTLFVRSRRGITLTPAGAHLLTEGKELIARSKRIVGELRLLAQLQEYHITLGVSLLHRSRLLYELWNKFSNAQPQHHLNVVNLQLNSANVGNFTQNADIIEGLNDGEFWQGGWQFLQLCQVPLACAVPKHHPLAQKERLTTKDLTGSTVMTIRRGMSPCLDQFADDLSNAGVRVLEAESYGLSLFSSCILN